MASSGPACSTDLINRCANSIFTVKKFMGISFGSCQDLFGLFMPKMLMWLKALDITKFVLAALSIAMYPIIHLPCFPTNPGL